MSGKMYFVSRNLCLALATMLAAMTAGVCAAADAPATPAAPLPVASQQPSQPDEVIDEVWVRGKHLSEMIEDAEDGFFKLYNKLNKNSDYDVFCGTMSLNPGSMIMVRKCAPGFIVYRYYSPITNTVSYSTGSFGGCSSMNPVNVYPVTDSNGDYSYYGGGCYSSGSSGYGGTTAFSGNYGLSSYSPSAAAAGALLEERSLDYGNNVLKVVTSDPRLLEMVRNLGGLYDEMDSLQERFTTLKEAGQAVRRARKSGKPYTGPRVL